MALTDTGRLGCGRDVDDLWAHINEEPDEHEAACPFCQAARADLASLASATTTMAEADRDDTRLVNRPGAVDAIVAIARTEVRRGRTLPLTCPTLGEPGELTISEQAVARIVREASDSLADVEARGCRVSLVDDESGAAPTQTGRPAAFAVELSLTVGRTVRIAHIAQQLRNSIADAVEHRVGVGVTAVAIHVEDLHDV